jgi:hypothetical protein
MATDSVDEYIQIGESTTIKWFYKFATAINCLFGEEYPILLMC